jgi:transcriptional regulator with XRE-family HTH domain
MTTPPGPPKPSAKVDTGVPERRFDGRWFRREREQLAIGRAKLAAQLGTSPHQLFQMELKNREVPEEWIAVVAALGFRVASEPAASSVPDQEDESQAAVASASSPSDQLTPVFDGESFRQERLRLRMTISGLAARLRISMMEIGLLELTEPGKRKMVPQQWLRALRGLGFWQPKPLLGDWFRSERERLGIARDLLAARLGVKVWRVEHVETDKPPAQVPAEWIATLLALGFIDSRR